MRGKSANADVLIGRIAASRHGVIRIDQLAAAGLDDSAVARRVAAGRLHRIHRGVYAVGHPALSREGEWLAAVDAFGAGAVLSHFAAACLWRLLDWDGGRSIDVTVPSSNGRRSRIGIRLHRSLSLDARCFTRRSEIPVTTIARTCADLSRTESPATVRRARRQAAVLGFRLDSRDAPTRSELEDRFLALCRRHRLPPPEVNTPVGPYFADFLWPSAKLIVETDGWRYHRGREAFEDDHERHLRLRAIGFDVVRITDLQIRRSPAAVASTIRALLDASVHAVGDGPQTRENAPGPARPRC